MIILHRRHGVLAGQRGRGEGRPGRRRALSIATLAVLLASTWGMAVGQEDKPADKPEVELKLGEIIERAGPGVVLISVESKTGQKVGIGSGFLVPRA
jgi:hypothetical protein